MNTQELKMIYQNTIVYVATRITKKFWWKPKEAICLIDINFLTMISISLFLLLQKRIYPYEYLDDWGIFNETWLPEKEHFYIHLNMEDITDADYMRTYSL